jgi:Sec-independent protein translocase protein TatA
MGFGTEILFILMLGLLVLGPKQSYAMLGQVSRAKAELENAARGIKSQLETELDVAPLDRKTDGSPELAREQSGRGFSA